MLFQDHTDAAGDTLGRRGAIGVHRRPAPVSRDPECLKPPKRPTPGPEPRRLEG